MPHRTHALALCWLSTLACGAPVLRAQDTQDAQDAQDADTPKPLPAGPDALTDTRFREASARFWEGVLLAECKAGDALREPWQPHVAELMTVYAEGWCALIPGADLGPRAVALCSRLRQLGCTDPVVHFVSGNVAFWHREPEVARTAFAAAAKGLAGRPSPLVRLLLHEAMRHFHGSQQEPDQAREAAAARDACLVELASCAELGGGNERIHLQLVLGAWSDNVGPDDLAALERMEQRAGKDRYALLVLRATYHTAMAWAARGQGAASTVGAADRKDFQQHLRAAADAATKAHRLCPQHPEAPTAMLKVLGPGGAEPQQLRAWFDRAVAAQLDWMEAYTTYMHYLQPRWGGSQKALRDLGAECLATKRFDTIVPALYRTALHYVGLGVAEPTAVWAPTTVQRRLAEIDDGYLAAATTDAAKWNATSHRVIALALGGKAEDAAATYEKHGSRLDPSALGIYGVTEAWLQKVLRPHLKQYAPARIATRDLFAGFADARSPGLEQARPLRTHTEAATTAQAEARYAKWLGDTYVAAYDKAGTRDAKWDADARALLAAFGELALGEPSAASRELATRLRDAGCKDPLATYAMVRALPDERPAKRAQRLADALPVLAEQQPPVFSWWLMGHLSDVARLAGRPGVGSGLLPQMRETMIAALADPVFTGDARRHWVRTLWGTDELMRAGNDWITDRMAAGVATTRDAEPWLVHLVIGLHNARKAKHLAASPAEREAQLALAAEHLGKAHALCPLYPEAAVGMIVVASLQPGTVSPREWFDRAVAAQIDYAPAYAAYVDTLRPRHGGSVLAMYRFASECLESGRFDTDVPLWYARTLQRIQDEVDEPRAVWAAAGVPEALQRLFAGYEAAKQAKRDPAWLQSGRCVLAWAGGRYDDALAAWRAAGQKIDARWLPIVGQQDAELIELDLGHLARNAGK